MKFINTDGMAFIGPGSEWLWTMISGIVLAITFIAIYAQLRLQRKARAIEQLASLQGEMLSERMCRSRLAVLIALRDGADPTKRPPTVFNLVEFWERVASLVRAGHIDRRLFFNYMGPHIQLWWGWLAPSMRREREVFHNPADGKDFEWLAGRMAEMGQQAHYRHIDEAYLGPRAPGDARR